MKNEEIKNFLNTIILNEPGDLDSLEIADIALHIAFVRANDYLKRTGIITRYKRNVFHTNGYKVRNHVNLVKEIEWAIFEHAFKDFAPKVARLTRSGSDVFVTFDPVHVYNLMHETPLANISEYFVNHDNDNFPYYLINDIYINTVNALSAMTTFYGSVLPVRLYAQNAANSWVDRRYIKSLTYPSFIATTGYLDLYPRSLTNPSVFIFTVEDLHNAYKIIANTFLTAFPQLRRVETVALAPVEQLTEQIIETLPVRPPYEPVAT